MTNDNYYNLSAEISASDKIIIKPVTENNAGNFDRQARVFAINWFNLKSSFFYNLYSLLARKYVIKVSGQLHFKGKLITQLEGPENRRRENLLIVSYPNPMQFLALVKFKFFQLISIFRLMAVKQFCFGFTENLMSFSDSRKAFNYSKKQVYLVHHFQGDKLWLKENYQQLISTAEQQKVYGYYCGLTTANLVREKSGQQQPAVFFMDGILMFTANSRAVLETFIATEYYQLFKQQNTENSLYLFSRSH